MRRDPTPIARTAAQPSDRSAVVTETESSTEPLGAWTFARADDRLTIRREWQEHAWQLAIIDNRSSRVFTFPDLARLVTFQHDMEAFLVRTGWSLAQFMPDRRDGGDRRGFPRENNDRRRWWTDVVPGVRSRTTPGR